MDKIFQLIKEEEKRQKEVLVLIPSENYAWPEVRKAVGSVLMHKYSEGLPYRRYYQGNFVIDEIEVLCRKRALEAFGLSQKKWHANVQPHSGCEANLAVYNALLSPGEKIMSMYLPDGGHLSHGWQLPNRKITLVSKIWQIEFYRVDQKTKVFDYDAIARQAKRFRPNLIVSGGTAYPREIKHRLLAKIAHSVGAYYLADVAHEAGLIAGGANNSPFPCADVVMMTTHKTLRGPRGAIIVCRKELADLIDSSVFPGVQGGPHNHTIAGIAIALEKTKTKEFKNYARQTVVNAKKLAKLLLKAGLDVVSGGTDKHLILIDLRNKGISGWFVAWALEYAGMVVNRNTVPYDTASPYYPSGLRLGTPAVTARGMKEREMAKIAEWIVQVIDQVGERRIPQDETERRGCLKAFRQEIEKANWLREIKDEVRDLCRKFPVPES